MVRMIAPFTRTPVDVADKYVAKRLESGYVIAGGEPFEDEHDVPEEPEEDEGEPDEAPTEDSTIAEIRAYAEAHGIKLPRGGRKADLLDAIG